MKATILVLSGAATLALVSCENPADTSKKASVSDAVTIDASKQTGEKWVFSEGSTITFTGSKVTGSHSGGFNEFSGHFYVDGDTLAASGHKVVIDMNSTFSDAEKLTTHLKAADFFNVEEFPESTFEVSAIREEVGTKGETHTLTGNFTLHGVTKSIEIPVTVNQSEDLIHVLADFYINRLDFGIAYEGKKDDLIRKEVVIKFDLKAKPE